MEIDIAEDLTATPAQLKTIGTLVRHAQAADVAVQRAEEVLKKAQAHQRKLKEHVIPEAMAEAGLSSVTTPDGLSVDVKSTLYASIPKKYLNQAVAWLYAHDLGSLVRTTMSVPLGANSAVKTAELALTLSEMGFTSYSVDNRVNTGSVKAAIRELTEQGVDVPNDLFGAHWVTRAEIKSPKS